MAKKDILKNLASLDLVFGILLSKPKNKDGMERFDAKKLYGAISDSSKKYERLDIHFDVGRNGSLLNGMSREFHRYLSILRMGHTIGQFQDELCTEVYYLNRQMISAIAKDLEGRLGTDFLKRLEPVTKEIWENYRRN